jgi:hypothetical protein
MSTIAERLRHSRGFRGLTSTQLDQLADLPSGTAARIEAASRSSKKDAPYVEKLAAALGVRAEWLQRGATPEGAPITAENCLQLIPHSAAQVYGRPAILLSGPEMFVMAVVGTENYLAGLLRFLGQNVAPSKSEPVQCAAWLAPEPNNPRDKRAVRVDVSEWQVGHLMRESAGAWQPILVEFTRRYGLPIATPAEIYCEEEKRSGRQVYRIDLCLPVSLPGIVVFDFSEW